VTTDILETFAVNFERSRSHIIGVICEIWVALCDGDVHSVYFAAGHVIVIYSF